MVKYPARRSAVASALQDARDYRGISQRKLSERLQEVPTYVHMIESGQKGVLVEEFIEIALTLDLDPVELLKEVLKVAPRDRRRRRKSAGG
jgi:transcriptional regulator with XRE-family HTH domain